MPLTAGTRLGPYEILSPLGAGGMGEVYRAKDSRLDRIVAIKVLPAQLSSDPELRERFDREARTISQLSHPHICTLHDVGHQGGIDFLVMEHLEGEARLARGALPLDEALRIAMQLASALDIAHRAGVVHRDIKPGNVMLTRAGAKLLDFGLAKAGGAGWAGGAGGAGVETGLATTPPSLTARGTILGTFQYMSPEQIEGQEADARTDIFAFGVLLYEMITGRKAFAGKSQASLLGAILKDQPQPISELKPIVPASLDWVVTRCLAKDPDERWQHVRDLLFELRRLTQLDAAASSTSRRRVPALVTVAGTAVLLVLAGAIGAWGARALWRQPPAIPSVVTFSETAPPGVNISGGPAAPQTVISPDGSRIVFSAVEQATGMAGLYVRALGSLESRRLPGTDDAELPFWSPDGRYVGFFTATRKLKKVPLDGGAAQTICDVPGIDMWGGGTWSRGGVILFSPGSDSPLFSVASAGGSAPSRLTEVDLDRKERGHVWPVFLPDGVRFLYLIQSSAPATRGIYVGSLSTKEKTRLVNTDVRAAFASPHRLVFMQEETLFAQSLDDHDTRVIGEATPIATHVAHNPSMGIGRASFSVSDSGVLVYRTGGVGGIRMSELAWFDRHGAPAGSLSAPAQYDEFDVSVDGTHVAASEFDARSQQLDIWLLAQGEQGRRLTFDPSDDNSPIWSPDGRRIVFRSERGGSGDLYVTAIGGSDQLLFKSPDRKTPETWTPDGRFVIFQTQSRAGEIMHWLVPTTGAQTPQALPLRQARELAVSPDGHWIAYTSDDSSTSEICVQPFPPSGARWQISAGGGFEPRWRRDSRELFFVSTAGRLMAVDVAPGATFSATPPKELFQLRSSLSLQYGVSPDGQRFIVNTPIDPGGASMTVVVNWPTQLKEP